MFKNVVKKKYHLKKFLEEEKEEKNQPQRELKKNPIPTKKMKCS